jgi:hypothetical protein
MYVPLFRLPRALHSNKIARFRKDTILEKTKNLSRYYSIPVIGAAEGNHEQTAQYPPHKA